MNALASHYTIIALVCAALSMGACRQRCGDAEEPSSRPPAGESRVFQSPIAPYQIEFGQDWKRLPPEAINADADFAATYDDRYYALVIPQQLPEVEGVDTPNLKSLKEASLSRMKRNVQGFEVERTGPVALDNQSAISVFVEGNTDGERVQYVATYAIYRGWGLQLIAWGPAQRDVALIPKVDALFEGWKFTEPSVQSSDEGGDASSRPTERADGQTHTASSPDARAGDDGPEAGSDSSQQ